MNSNRRVLVFTTSSIGIYLLLSIIAAATGFNWEPFKKINLVADVFTSKGSIASTGDDLKITPILLTENNIAKDFNLYTRPNFITNFGADTTKPSMTNFIQKLDNLKKGKKKKIRIAYFGDSMIEGDLLTQTLRKLLQKEFGGNGVGFVPITSPIAGFRQTVTDYFSDGWKDENFKTEHDGNLFFSGHLFRGSNDWVQMADQTITDTAAIIEKSLLYGRIKEPISVIINNIPATINGTSSFNRTILRKDQNKNIKLEVNDERLPVYGISFESQYGVIVDNFSFRGITGVELNKIDSNFLKAINNTEAYYDLLIFQYGVNVLFRPNDSNFSWYSKSFLPVIQKIKHCFTEADVLLVSTADRAFRYDGEYKSAKGIDSLIKMQAAIAYQTGCTFYNQFETMGGKNSIVKWAAAKPSLANKDYVHPNNRGADSLGTSFFNAIMKDYKKYLTTLH
jgi:lysophospholipase L1-like esterase